jgi:hypothetical protein
MGVHAVSAASTVRRLVSFESWRHQVVLLLFDEAEAIKWARSEPVPNSGVAGPYGGDGSSAIRAPPLARSHTPFCDGARIPRYCLPPEPPAWPCADYR